VVCQFKETGIVVEITSCFIFDLEIRIKGQGLKENVSFCVTNTLCNMTLVRRKSWPAFMTPWH